jgi:hypothetical protein
LYGGPNYFIDGPDVTQIHIDNDGDAVEDITFSLISHNPR